jgi:hypothetical protein
MEKINDNFINILKSNEYFMMEQYSDIFNENKFKHVSFLGNTKTYEILNNKDLFEVLTKRNDYINNDYIQVFINDSQYNNNVIKLKHSTTNLLYPYKVISNFDDLFNGLLKIDNYFININTLDVFCIDLNKSDDNIEYICFIKIGKLINSSGYNFNNLSSNNFNNLSSNNLNIDEKVKNKLSKSSIIGYDNKLFYVDLTDFEYSNNIKENKNNFKYVDEIEELYLSRHDYIKEDFEKYEHEYEFYNDEYYQKVNLIHENEQKDFGNILDGFILLGYHNSTKLYLLLNNGSIWHYKEEKTSDLLTTDNIEFLSKKSLKSIGYIY